METSYWIFQSNPDVWKSIFDDLRDINEIEWYVKVHKDKIKQGDKVIIWITGRRGGCFALGEIASSKKIDAAMNGDKKVCSEILDGYNRWGSHLGWYKKSDKDYAPKGIRLIHEHV